MSDDMMIPVAFAVAGLVLVPIYLWHGFSLSALGFGLLSALGWVSLWMKWRNR